MGPSPSEGSVPRSLIYQSTGLPVHEETQYPVVLVAIEHVPHAAPIQVDVAQDLDIATTVCFHQIEPPLFDPLQALQALGRLLLTQCLARQVVQLDAKACLAMDILQQVESRQGPVVVDPGIA